jgi:hypothetical protein
MFCFYTEGVPTGRRKPQGKRERSRIREGEPDLLGEALVFPVISGDPALLGAEEGLAAQYRHPETSPPNAVSECARPSLEHPIVSPAEFPTDVSIARSQTFAAKRQVKMLPGIPTLTILSHETNELEVALEIAEAEFHSQLSEAIANGLKSSSVYVFFG